SPTSADGYWAPFKIACHHNQPPRIREAALDCLQKLIAHNVLRGALPLDAVVDQSHTRIPTDDGQGVPGTDNDLSRLDTSSPLPVVTDVPSDALPNDSASSGAAPSQAEPERPAPAPAANGTPAITARSTSLLATGVGDTPHYPPNPYLIDEIIHTVCTTFSGSQGDDTVQLQVLKVLLTAVTSTACEVHQVSLLKVIQTCFNIHLNSRAPVNQMTAKASLTQMVNLIFSRMERYADVLARSLETGSMAEIEKLTGLHDAGAEKTEASDVIVEGSSTKARQLALELIMSVMNNCGPVFQSDDLNSTYNQKRMVLQALLKICENPQTLADFYLNYDCDISMVSLFERIVNVCSRVAQGRDTSTPVAATGIMGFAVSAAGLDSKEQLVKAQDRRLKLRGLCCLVALVNSLAEWSKDIAPSLPIISRIKKNIEVAKAMKTELKVEPAEKKSVDTPRSTTSDVPTKSFLDALAATNQANPVLVYKHPLHNVSMEHKHLAQAFSTGSATSLAATPTEWSPDDNVQIENLASRKLQMRNAIKQFNVKPTKGVKALIRDGFVEEDPMSIAKFLRTTDALTKAAIGEYLGEADAFNVDVMHAFIDTLDFTEMDFVPALRAFLQTFRLPGEAQKIDRIMEKFADRFYENNPDMFAKADTAYTLAFSVIMLNTDLHSPSIKHRMTPEGFIKNNRGINDDGDLPDELLTRIYEQVSKNEIIMEEEHAGRLAQMAVGWGAGDLDDRQRMEFLAFEGANDDEEAGDESSGAAGLGEPKASDLALEGFSFSIRLASIFRMETERDAFVTSLSKLTGLSHIHDIRPKNIRAIKTLIVIADYLGEYLEGSWMQVLKAISHLERMQIILNRSSSFDGKRSGDYDRDGEGEEAGVIPFSGKPSSSNAYRTIEDVTSQARPNPAVEKLIAEFHNQATVVAVDRIFTNTLKLSATAIIHFFRCLCYVSMEEVGLDPVTTAPGAIPNQAAGAGTGSSAPRMYLLQKIVEIAYYNMPRIRFEWTQIWRILQPYFNTVACHPNFNVATFAVDSLRQLSMKFLEREELGHWTAQNEFLKSFEWIIKHNPDPRIKELILSSTRQMIQARGKSLRSGWKSIFVVLSKAAQSGDEKILRLSVSVVQMIFSGFFECVVGNAGAGFVDFVACLVEISLVEEPSGEEVAAGGIQLLQAVAKWLSGWNGDVNVPGRRKPSFAEAELKHANVPLTPGNAPAATQRHAAQPYFSANGLVTEDHFFLKWFPVLSAFSRIIIDSESVNVRTKAMDGLFDTLKSAGAIFEVGYWKNIQRSVILPIFAELGRGSDDDDDDDDETLGGERPTRVSIAKSTYKDPEMTAIYIHGLRLYIDLFTHYFTTLTANPDLLRSVFDLLVGMLTKRDEKLATTGGICLHGFIRDNMSSIDNDVIWGVVSEAIEKAFRGTLPGELLCCEYEAASAQSATPAPVKEKSEVAKIGLRAAREAVGEGKKVTLDTLDFEYVLIKCVTHLELVQGVRDLVFGSAVESSRRGTSSATSATSPSVNQTPTLSLIPAPYRARWVKCLYRSYAVARAFNEETALRQAIYRKGLVPQTPHLIKQETVSFATYLRVLFAVYKLDDTARTEVGQELVKETLDVLTRYTEFVADQGRHQLHLGLWSPVVVLVFKELLSMDELWVGPLQDGRGSAPSATHNGNVPAYFRVAVRIMTVERAEVRAVLQEFLERVGDVYIRV
ncbi:uncharacterized protein EV422DRAFT_495953, partial [Fimicolochytrium jonesii]|uniref:uncharacterized protein n=1 Tax=Fimicolochytrium jonesii TaxID=1396493 RepID=UPI0022FE4539